MSFNAGDRVIHKSDNKPRKMVVVIQVFKTSPPTDIHSTLANTGHFPDGYYYCTWISGTKKGEGYFSEAELELQ